MRQGAFFVLAARGATLPLLVGGPALGEGEMNSEANTAQTRHTSTWLSRIRLVAKSFEQRVKFRAPIGKSARKNATSSSHENVRGAEGAAHIFARCLCRVLARGLANWRTKFDTMFK